MCQTWNDDDYDDNDVNADDGDICVIFRNYKYFMCQTWNDDDYDDNDVNADDGDINEDDNAKNGLRIIKEINLSVDVPWEEIMQIVNAISLTA